MKSKGINSHKPYVQVLFGVAEEGMSPVIWKEAETVINDSAPKMAELDRGASSFYELQAKGQGSSPRSCSSMEETVVDVDGLRSNVGGDGSWCWCKLGRQLLGNGEEGGGAGVNGMEKGRVVGDWRGYWGKRGRAGNRLQLQESGVTDDEDGGGGALESVTGLGWGSGEWM